MGIEKDKPEAGSTRPEMPPAKEIMKQTIFTQIPHAEGKCSGCLNVTYEAGDDKVNIFCNQCGALPEAQPTPPAYDYSLFVSDWLGKHGQYFGYLADMLKDFHNLVAAQPTKKENA